MSRPAEARVGAGDLRSETRRLIGGAVIYLLPQIVGRGLAFLLAPIYTRVMSPADYGIVGLAAALTPLATTALSFGVHQSVLRLHYQFDTAEARRRFHGSITVFQLTVPLVITLCLLQFGHWGMLNAFKTIRFDPHLKLILWTAYLGVFPNIALNLLVMREQARQAAIFSMATSLLSVACALWFVVWTRQGAVGQLKASLVAALATAALSIGITVGLYGLALSMAAIKRAVAYGLPLVPHLLSNWALSASDRWVLERRVDAASLGRYSLGYTIASAGIMISASIARAFYPMVTRRLQTPEESADVPRLGTLVLFANVLPCLGLALVAEEAVQMLTPVSYHSAAKVVPWVVLGVVFQALYGLLSQGTYFSGKTLGVPVVTLIAALSNVGLNLLFVPRYGIMAAAVNTAVSYAIMAALHGWLSKRTYPIAWEYSRWASMLAVAMGCFVLGEWIAIGPMYARLAIKVVVTLVVFPAAMLGISGGSLRQYVGMLRSSVRAG